MTARKKTSATARQKKSTNPALSVAEVPVFAGRFSSVDELDVVARQLLSAWGKSFGDAPRFDGPKKNKARDVVARMAGFKHGYFQFHASLNPGYSERKKFANGHAYPTYTEQEAEDLEYVYLPDMIALQVSPTFVCDYSIFLGSTKELCKTRFDQTSENYLFSIIGDDGEGGLMEDHETMMDIPVWSYICRHYEAVMCFIDLPYGDELTIAGDPRWFAEYLGADIAADFTYEHKRDNQLELDMELALITMRRKVNKNA